MTDYNATRAARLSRIQRELDALRDAIPDMETEAQYCRDPNEAMESEAYADLLSAIYALTEIDAVFDAEQELRFTLDADAKEQAECDAAEFRMACRDEQRFEDGGLAA